MSALRFPADFPPDDPWKKFFIGVRWLGPDLSFFRELKQVQSQRGRDEMSAWAGGRRQALAEAISEVLAQQLGWKTSVFLPEDAAAVAFHGPRFDFSDPEVAFDAVVERLQREFSISAPAAFWASHGESTFEQLVDGLLALEAAADSHNNAA